jgi:hypothetical protein
MLWTGKPINKGSILKFSYSLGKDKRWLRAWIRNACHREVSLTTKKEIPVNSNVEIEFLYPDTSSSVVLTGTVVKSIYIQNHECFLNEITLTDIVNRAAEILKQMNGTDTCMIRKI